MLRQVIDGRGNPATADSASKNALERQQAPAKAPPVASPRAAKSNAEKELDQSLQRLGERLPGDLGIAVRDLDSGWTAEFNGETYFPQQSVSKLWVALAVLDQVDRGKLDLSKKVTLHRDDLAVFFQPIRSRILRNDGYTTTLEDLLERAIMHSDNTANDFLLQRVGGPDVIRAVLARKGLGGIRFGPGEKVLQSRTAGLKWKPEYSIGPAFVNARAELPLERRRTAFQNYLADPIDGATPTGITHALAMLKKGKLLSPSSTEHLLHLMAKASSGPRRLSGGVPPSWSIGHKTGTGQILEGTEAGYNDVGIVTAPDGRSYSVAVLIGRTKRPLPERMRLMQDTVRAVVSYHDNQPD